MRGHDQRIPYGVACTWWDSIHNVSNTSVHPAHEIARGIKIRSGGGSAIARIQEGLPCCPHCGSMLFEVESEQVWFDGVDKYEANGHPGYRKFIEWMRGKCFPSLEEAQAHYSKETSNSVTL